MTEGAAYDRHFFDHVAAGAARSASVVIGALGAVMRPARVVDVGCGEGAWTAVIAAEPWVERAVGVDGDYVDRAHLRIPDEDFRVADLSRPFDLGERFDLAVSLEVGEHLPPGSSQDFVASLVAHADAVLFSAAVPGQGGASHVNERPLDAWRADFAAHGYSAYDPVRPAIAGDARVEPWYRYNVLLYVREGTEAAWPGLAPHALDPHAPVPDRRSALWRARCAVIGALPRPMVDAAAAAKHRLARIAARG